MLCSQVLRQNLEKETNGFNQRTVRTKVKEVKGTLKRKQDDAGRVGRKEYDKLREGYEKVRKGLILGGRLHRMPEIAR